MPHPKPPPDPRQAAALLQQASAQLQRNPQEALRLLAQAEQLAPPTIDLHLTRALAARHLNDIPTGMRALDAALALDPDHFVALLSRAVLIEQSAGPRPAARAYRLALQRAPDESRLPPALQAAIRHGREIIAQDTATLHAYLRAQTASLRAHYTDPALIRFDESLDAFAGAARLPVQRPLLLSYSRLPAIPFYDRALFPWLPELEAATPLIQAELHGALAQAQEDFVPYIQFPPGVPVNQWGELNHSSRWSSYFLWQDGTRHDAACAQCPQTAALLDCLPLMRQPGFAPTAVFSALEPHTHIPPHTGSAATRLLCHLPLILPGPARFRVGPETRHWRIGEAWVFDDTIEHEAWNDADEMRVILILDLWNPLLTEAEHQLIAAMMTARNAYYAAPS
jgi:aspartyl/asparaginyl beta-hydroxylase (cupin superfamily)